MSKLKSRFEILKEKIKSIKDSEKGDHIKILVTSLILVCILIRFVFPVGVDGLFSKKKEISCDNSINSEFVDNGEKQDKEEKSGKKSRITVYITGAVSHPGVITVGSDERLDSAIKKIGGLAENADFNRINLAMKLEDEGHYIIPYKGQDIEEKKAADDGKNLDKSTESTDSSGGEKNGKININIADEKELEEIPGVGPSTSKKIIDYRKESGEFENIEDIKNVSGIGDKKFENMKSYISVK